MKEIHSITKEGIEYTDEGGNPQYIDFETCYNNWLERESQRQDPYYDDRARKIAQEWRCVGQRDRYANPPYIELFTEPVTRFEFKSPEGGFHDLRLRIEKAGWRTSDLG